MGVVDLALQLALIFALVYNNSLVVMGPLAWGGVSPRRALPLMIIAESAGALLSPMRPMAFSTPYYAAALAFYLAFTLAKVALPISVFLYALRGLNAIALAIWFGTAPAAALAGYALGRGLRPSQTLALLILAAVGFMFGANNIAFINDTPWALLPIVLGNVLGVRFSRWIIKLYAFSFSGALSASASATLIAVLGTAFGVPISFTFATYSTLLGAAAARRLRIIRLSDFLRAIAAITAALLLAYATERLLA